MKKNDILNQLLDMKQKVDVIVNEMYADENSSDSQVEAMEDLKRAIRYGILEMSK